MLHLFLTLVLLGALASPAGTSVTCPVCSSSGKCTDTACPAAQDSCRFSQMKLENKTVIQNGSCVSHGDCQEGTYMLSYGPNSSFWISTTCCESHCSGIAHQEDKPEAQLTTTQCYYCSGEKSAPCNTLSVMNCTVNQTMCVTINGTWSGGPHATTTHKVKITTCYSCSDPNHCRPFNCPEDRNYCLQTSVITALENGNSVTWRNGSCVASKDCKFNSTISALTYNAGLGFWVNATCCQGDCQTPTPLVPPASRNLSQYLCPTCSGDPARPCNASLYVHCPDGETECVYLDLVTKTDGRNMSVRGCASSHLCDAELGTEGLLEKAGYQLSSRPHCSSSQRATMDSSCLKGSAPGLHLALPVLLMALGVATLS